LYFAIGAVLIEFIYATITVLFAQYLSGNEQINNYLHIVTAVGLSILGIYNLLVGRKKRTDQNKERIRKRVGFGKGLLLGLINPLTIPFWLGITLYLQQSNWIQIEGNYLWAYTLGLAVGTFGLLVCVDLMGSRFQKLSNNRFAVYQLPGLTFIAMGAYYLYLILQA
jgi:threonine/homoserine/homoserine lactone efflux protein